MLSVSIPLHTDLLRSFHRRPLATDDLEDDGNAPWSTTFLAEM